jgi:hypothetical protein
MYHGTFFCLFSDESASKQVSEIRFLLCHRNKYQYIGCYISLNNSALLELLLTFREVVVRNISVSNSRVIYKKYLI